MFELPKRGAVPPVSSHTKKLHALFMVSPEVGLPSPVGPAAELEPTPSAAYAAALGLHKAVVYEPTDEGPKSHYMPEDVAAILARPNQYAGEVFTGPISACGIEGDWSRSCWGRPTLWQKERVALGAMPDTEKLYRGPVYVQGANATAPAWATIHALQAIGVHPTERLATDLVNAAVSSPGDLAALARLVGAHRADTAFNVPALGSLHTTSLHEVARTIQSIIDSNGVLIASVANTDARVLNGATYPVCVTGYRIFEGRMDLQIIDSACGEGAVTLEGLLRELRHDNLPLVAVAKINSSAL